MMARRRWTGSYHQRMKNGRRGAAEGGGSVVIQYNLVRRRSACQRPPCPIRFATMTSTVLQELEWRGFVQQATPDLAAHFAKGPVTAYCGFDPTAPSLQLGNLMPLMLQKAWVKARLEAGMSFTEFSCMLLQAYHFLHLYRERQCTLQVGGSDQWSNITAGVDLIRRIENAEAHGLVAPMVTMASGKKFGKTEAGAIYLDPTLTSPYKFYQFWINVDDRDVENYLRLFTLKSRGEIEELVAEQTRNPAGRSAQRALAADVTTRAHGAEGLEG